MLNLGQIFAKFYLAKFARAGSNLAKINLMRGHSILIATINRGAQNVTCVGGCVLVVPGGARGGISAGPRGLFSALLLAVAIVLMIVC